MPHNIPHIQWQNLFSIDWVGQALYGSHLGSQRFKSLLSHYSSLGEAGALATPLSAAADRQSPEHISHNRFGERIDQIEYNPSYIELQELSYGRGIVGLKYDQKFLKEHKAFRHYVGFSAGFYFAQTETGLFCPICMTDALGRVLERHPVHPGAVEALKHIAATDLHELWQGAMFLTERQGGSDVGAAIVQATEKNGRWFLSGHKWFCSNVDAKAALVLARMPGSAVSDGTKGLGLFLVLRENPKDNSRTIEIQRIKAKLGVRSMASGEVILRETEAFLMGGVNEGFKIMAEMVNMSRLYNAVAAQAVSRRALLEAVAYGQERLAFGKKLTELPLWARSVAEMIAEFWGLQLLVLEATKALDGGDCGNAEQASLARLLTPMAKALSAKFSVFCASESMEAIGGNAYIEEHILPRLLRDAQVLPIWEGTTNIQSLDYLRAANKEGLDVLWKRISDGIERCKDSANARATLVESLFNELLGHVKSFTNQENARAAMEKSARLLSLTLLLEEATRTPEVSAVMLAAFDQMFTRTSATDPLGHRLAAPDWQKSTQTLLKSFMSK